LFPKYILLFLSHKLSGYLHRIFIHTPEEDTLIVSKFMPVNEEQLNILQRVSVLYRKYGIKSVTMDDVARELGISKKTLYQYVHDKDELVKLVVEFDLQRHEEHMQQHMDDSLNAVEEIAAIARCVNFMLKEYNPATEYDLRKYYPPLYLLVREKRREWIHRFIYRNLLKGKQEGWYREDLNEEIITKISVLQLDGMFESEVMSIREVLDPRFFSEFFVYHLRGIVNERGMSILNVTLKNHDVNTP
jgi:AcrR family transcriptional regulator